jgi:two-component system cell cycle sensor histidine kinase/response regulator CckA
VDDEEFVLDVGLMMLEEVGFSVRTASDGVEAVEIYRKHQDEIVCVVLDLMMPNMDGEQAFRELRRIRGDVKIVLSSGYQEQDVAERVVEMGFAGFVKKPYAVDTLIEQIRRALEGGFSSSGGSRASWTLPVA